MEEKKFKPRSDKFRWHSKQELYTYFKEFYGLSERHIDSEVSKVSAVFKLRKNQAIITAELWQKVGLNLEKKFSQA